MSAARETPRLDLPVRRALLDVPLYLFAGVACCLLVFFAPRVVPSGGYPYLAGLVAVAAGMGACALVFGPPRLALGVFVAYMTASHFNLSPFILPAGGIEWHPRELLLFALLGCVGVRVLRLQARFPASPVHFFVGALGLAWCVMAVTGLLAGNDRTNLIQEARYPLYLLAYVAYLDLLRDRASLWFVVRIVAAIAVGAALASLALFVYTYATKDFIPNIQNYLGEFVRRQVGPFLLQSSRPNAHMYFEVGVVMLVAMVACREVTMKARVLMVIGLGIFLAAIAVTMMRTAYIATVLGLVLLAFMSLPRAARVPVLLGLAALGLFGGITLGPLVYARFEQSIPELGVSIQARLEEIGGGLGVFQAHPLLGGGLGTSIEIMGYVSKVTQASYGMATYSNVHNVWLFFLFKGGLVAFVLAFFGLMGLGVYGLRVSDRLDSARERAFARALACAFLAQTVGSLAMPRLNYPGGFAFIALTAGVFALLGRRGGVSADDANGRR